MVHPPGHYFVYRRVSSDNWACLNDDSPITYYKTQEMIKNMDDVGFLPTFIVYKEDA